MRKIASLLPLLLFCCLSLTAQLNVDTLRFQDFEVVPQPPVWTFTGPVIYNSGFSLGTASPPNSPIGIGGSRAWETTTNSGGLILNFDNTAIPAIYDSIRVRFRLAAMNLLGTGGGPDNLDYVLIAYSTDGGLTFVNRMRIRGATTDNSFWPYSATGYARAYYTPTTEVVFQPTTSGLQSTFGYSTCEIVFPGTVSQIAMRITGRSSSSTDTWLVDNLVLIGENVCSPSSGSTTASACGSYTSPSGNHTWTTSGTYQDTLTNITGCDSLLTIALTITQPTTGNLTASGCGSYISPSGNHTWASSGTYMDTLTNTLGCDSVVTVNLTIYPASTTGSLTGTYCDSLRSPSGLYLWTQTGTYQDTITTIHGCDSIIVASIVIGHPTSSSITAIGCGSYISPSGIVVTSDAVFTDHIPNAAGCDSAITISVTIVNLIATITPNGQLLTAGPGGATSYQWLSCDSSFAAIPGATLRDYSPTASGNYAVIVSEAGCTDTSTCTAFTYVGIDHAHDSQLQVIPNPAVDHVLLQHTAWLAPIPYRILDLHGRTMSQGILSSPTTLLDISELSEGNYIIQVQEESPRNIRLLKLK